MVAAIWPANAVNDDDVEVYANADRAAVLGTFQSMRQQIQQGHRPWPYIALADFVAPKGSARLARWLRGLHRAWRG